MGLGQIDETCGSGEVEIGDDSILTAELSFHNRQRSDSQSEALVDDSKSLRVSLD